MEKVEREVWNFVINLRIPNIETRVVGMIMKEVCVGSLPWTIRLRAIEDWCDAVYVYLMYEILKRKFKEWQDKGYAPRTLDFIYVGEIINNE